MLSLLSLCLTQFLFQFSFFLPASIILPASFPFYLLLFFFHLLSFFHSPILFMSHFTHPYPYPSIWSLPLSGSRSVLRMALG